MRAPIRFVGRQEAEAMSRWAGLERLRGQGLGWAIPEIEGHNHLAVMMRDERKRQLLVTGWVEVQLTRGQRVAILVGNRAEGRRLGQMLGQWLQMTGPWIGVGEGLWGRGWEEVRRDERVVVLTYYQFLNQLDRWPRSGFYAVVLWGVDAWLQSSRLPVLEALLDLLARGRARVAICAVSPRLSHSWVVWLAQRFAYDKLGVVKPDATGTPRVQAIDLRDAGDEAGPLDFIEDDQGSCLVVASNDVAALTASCVRAGRTLRILPFADDGLERFQRVYLYVPRLELWDGELKRWTRRVGARGTLCILYHADALETPVNPEQVVESLRRRLYKMGGLVTDCVASAVGVQQFLVQFLRRVRFQRRLSQELAETYLGKKLGQPFVARCLEQLEQVLPAALGLVELPQYPRAHQEASAQPVGEQEDEEKVHDTALADVGVVHSGWLRLTSLGREAAVQFRRLEIVMAMRTESRAWHTDEDLTRAMGALASNADVSELLVRILDGGKPPPDPGTCIPDKRVLFEWRLQVAAFHTLHPRDERLPRLRAALLPPRRSPPPRRFRGFGVMAVLIPYLHGLFLKGSAAGEWKQSPTAAPSRCHYVHYRDLAQWLAASPDVIYRLLRRYFPAPSSFDLQQLKEHFRLRGRQSLGIQLCQQVGELAAVVQHAYLRPAGAGRPRRVLVRLLEDPRGDLSLPPGFTRGCCDCVGYAPHQRVCALSWHIVNQVGPSALPPSLYGRNIRCAPHASPCDCLAPRRLQLPQSLLRRTISLPHEALTAVRVFQCPILRCPGRVVIPHPAHSGQCEECGCRVEFDEAKTPEVWVSASRTGFLQKMSEVLTGIRIDVRGSHNIACRLAKRPLTLEPVIEYLQLEGSWLRWQTRTSTAETLERRRRLSSTDLILAPHTVISAPIQAAVAEAGVRLLTYPLSTERLPIAPDASLILGLRWAQRNPLLLAAFGSSVVLSALVTTAELAVLPEFEIPTIEGCLQQQIDQLIAFLRRRQFGVLQWMGLEGRIAHLQGDLVRGRLRAAAGRDIVAVRGRYLARKVPMPEGHMRAAQSPFDEAINEAHRQVGWILRAENAASGFGYFTPTHLFFHQRVPGKNVHLDLDEVTRRVSDNRVLGLFLKGELALSDFNEEVDAFGFPAYRAKATCVEAIHDMVNAVLQSHILHHGQVTTVLNGHRMSVNSLLRSLSHHNPSMFMPLVYLPADTLSAPVSSLTPLRTLSQHLRSRIHLSGQESGQLQIVEQVVRTCEAMIS